MYIRLSASCSPDNSIDVTAIAAHAEVAAVGSPHHNHSYAMIA
jgi:hypothetical protein